jgi:hypothetical protein
MNELDLLRGHDPAAGTIPQASRESLLAGLESIDETPGRRRRRRRLFVLAPIGVVALAATGGLAYAVMGGQPPATALKINCSVNITRAEFVATGGFTSVLDTTSGDPVADCASAYEQLGQVAPVLRAYDSGSVFVWVIPTDWPVPASWRALPTTFRSDARRLALKQRLDDPVDGPGGPGTICRSSDAVEVRVRGYLTELGLQGWSVSRLPGAAAGDGTTSCAFAWVDEGADQRVLIQAGPPYLGEHAPEERPYRRLVARLRSEIADRCLTMAQARAAAQSAVDESGMDVTITAAEAPAGRCASVDLTPGGAVRIILS